VSHLAVWAHAYEENLPALLALSPQERCWEVRLEADPGAPSIRGTIEDIGYVVDPNQHTALVFGHVENKPTDEKNNGDGPLRTGQFVTATIRLPPPSGVVAVPATALVEDGHDSIVFVQEAAMRPEYTLRRVAVDTRLTNNVLVRSHLTPQESELKLEPLRAEEKVVVQGAIEMKAALEDLKSAMHPVK
jgi:cobalt-zinc-cadmium efflux system membrane fusion protein